jgi:hypothetical protein
MDFRYCQRASGGTQKMRTARYSSGSSGIGALLTLRLQFGVLGLEGVGDVLEKDQAQDDVLVLGRVHVIAQRIGGGPELGFKAEVGRVAVLFNGLTGGFLCRHIPRPVTKTLCFSLFPMLTMLAFLP